MGWVWLLFSARYQLYPSKLELKIMILILTYMYLHVSLWDLKQYAQIFCIMHCHGKSYTWILWLFYTKMNYIWGVFRGIIFSKIISGKFCLWTFDCDILTWFENELFIIIKYLKCLYLMYAIHYNHVCI